MVDKIDTTNAPVDDTDFDAGVEATPAIEFGEAELSILTDYLLEVGSNLLDLNKDLLNQQLHTDASLSLVKNFAENQTSRSLVIAKIDRSGVADTESDAATQATQSETAMSDTLSNVVTAADGV